MKYTPEDDPDYNDLKAALEKVSAVVNVVNKKKAETENLQMLLEIQGQIAGAQVSALFPFLLLYLPPQMLLFDFLLDLFRNSI